MPEDFYRVLVRFAWALFVVAAIGLFGLGAGMARYLGATLDASRYLVGQVWVLGILFATYFLRRYFDDRDAAANLGRKLWRFLPWKMALLTGAAAGLTTSAAMTFLLIRAGSVSQGLLLILIGGFVGAVAFGVPPLKLVERGFGDLLLSVMLSAGVPSIAFLLLFGEYHRFLPMATFPLGVMNLAMLVAYGFPRFAVDRASERNTLLIRMGWQNGMLLHNVLILVVFLLVGLAAVFDFPSFAAFPSFLLLPLAIIQVFLMLRVASGAKPNWNAITLGPTALYAILVYIFAFSFWTH